MKRLAFVVTVASSILVGCSSKAPVHPILDRSTQPIWVNEDLHNDCWESDISDFRFCFFKKNVTSDMAQLITPAITFTEGSGEVQRTVTELSYEFKAESHHHDLLRQIDCASSPTCSEFSRKLSLPNNLSVRQYYFGLQSAALAQTIHILASGDQAIAVFGYKLPRQISIQDKNNISFRSETEILANETYSQLNKLFFATTKTRNDGAEVYCQKSESEIAGSRWIKITEKPSAFLTLIDGEKAGVRYRGETRTVIQRPDFDETIEVEANSTFDFFINSSEQQCIGVFSVSPTIGFIDRRKSSVSAKAFFKDGEIGSQITTSLPLKFNPSNKLYSLQTEAGQVLIANCEGNQCSTPSGPREYFMFDAISTTTCPSAHNQALLDLASTNVFYHLLRFYNLMKAAGVTDLDPTNWPPMTLTADSNSSRGNSGRLKDSMGIVTLSGFRNCTSDTRPSSLDASVIYHEAAHPIVGYYGSTRPKLWCGEQTCPMPSPVSDKLHQFADAFGSGLGHADCFSKWVDGFCVRRVDNSDYANYWSWRNDLNLFSERAAARALIQTIQHGDSGVWVALMRALPLFGWMTKPADSNSDHHYDYENLKYLQLLLIAQYRHDLDARNAIVDGFASVGIFASAGRYGPSVAAHGSGATLLNMGRSPVFKNGRLDEAPDCYLAHYITIPSLAKTRKRSIGCRFHLSINSSTIEDICVLDEEESYKKYCESDLGRLILN